MQTSSIVLVVAGGILAQFVAASPLNVSAISGPAAFTVGDIALTGGVRFPINAPYGRSAPLPNHVYTMSQASGLGSDPVFDLFQSGAAGPPDGTNTSIAGPAGVLHGLRAGGTLGLQLGDKLNGVSSGNDGTGPFRTGLLFTVDPDAFGATGSAVNGQAILNRAGGGVFAAQSFAPFGVYAGAPMVAGLVSGGTNVQVADPEDFGLATDKPIAKQSRPGNFEDDLDGLAMRLGSTVFFTLDPFSPSLSPATSPADIFTSQLGSDSFDLYRSHTTAGLDPLDQIDALALSVAGNAALFSLAPDSPSLIQQVYSPGDVFITNFDGQFSLYAGYASLGLTVGDNLNGLDVYVVPEPATDLLTGFALTALGLLTIRRKRTPALLP